jgi:hypothetical protein
LIGPLGAKASIWTECLFVDPIADIAVLGPPDNQSLSAEAEAYEALLVSCTPLKIGGVIGWDQPTPASLIALDGRSIDCAVRSFGARCGLRTWLSRSSAACRDRRSSIRLGSQSDWFPKARRRTE